MRESASEIACSSALKMLALFGSLVVLVNISMKYRCCHFVPHLRAISVQETIVDWLSYFRETTASETLNLRHGSLIWKR